METKLTAEQKYKLQQARDYIAQGAGILLSLVGDNLIADDATNEVVNDAGSDAYNAQVALSTLLESV